MEVNNSNSNLTTVSKVDAIVDGKPKTIIMVNYPTLSNYDTKTERIKRLFKKLRRTKRIHENKYESFADERIGNKAKAFINAKDYFEDLFSMILQAKKSIYICGLCISPELFLIRPVSTKVNFETRLMDVLKLKAEQNVSIKILVYKEIPATICTDSLHAKRTLNFLNPNIQVRRHPRNNFIIKSWANHEKIIVIDELVAYVGGIDLFWGRYDNEFFPITDEPNDENLFEWPGLDYSNDRRKDKTDLKQFMTDYINRATVPRMPWHDIAVRLEGPVVIDVWRHFLQRWSFRSDHHNKYPIGFIGRKLHVENLYRGNLNCQIVRSATHWSVGNHTLETSILNAYCELIDNAKHYILIENQFFLSNTFSSDEAKHSKKSKMLNNVVYHLRKRIEKAYLENQKFRVIIFLPLIPAFAGDIKSTQSLKSLIKYTYRTINRHHGLSLIEKLLDVMGDKYLDYISFFSLRNHALLNGVPKTELIYIHAKIMLVDDHAIIIGSANLNDRSLLGKRDSEVAVVIKADGDRIKSMLNGEEVEICEFVKNFRMELFRQHLGVDKTSNDMKILDDPVSDEFWNFITNRARTNTKIYRDIFKCSPDDIFESFEDIKNKYDESCPECLLSMQEKYSKLKEKIVGHIVEFPLNFLKKENLSRGMFTKEKVININIFL